MAADKARLVVMSAGEAKLSPGMTLSSATSDLVLSSRSDLSLDAVKLLVSQEATVQGMRDVSLQNVDFGANAKATVGAARNLNVDGMTFSRPPASVLMEATTLRLSNGIFTALTIRLNSLKGPIDGKYPNFDGHPGCSAGRAGELHPKRLLGGQPDQYPPGLRPVRREPEDRADRTTLS